MSGLKKSNLKASSHTPQTKPSTTKPFIANQYVRPGFTEKQVIEAKEGFDLFDPGRTGYVEAAGSNLLIQLSKMPWYLLDSEVRGH